MFNRSEVVLTKKITHNEEILSKTSTLSRYVMPVENNLLTLLPSLMFSFSKLMFSFFKNA